MGFVLNCTCRLNESNSAELPGKCSNTARPPDNFFTLPTSPLLDICSHRRIEQRELKIKWPWMFIVPTMNSASLLCGRLSSFNQIFLFPTISMIAFGRITIWISKAPETSVDCQHHSVCLEDSAWLSAPVPVKAYWFRCTGSSADCATVWSKGTVWSSYHRPYSKSRWDLT